MLLAAALAHSAFIACNDDERALPDDERTRQIAGVAELAANAYAAAGPEGLYDYLAPEVTERCSKDNLKDALSGEDVPNGFRRLERIEFDGHDASTQVVQAFGDGERASQWAFTLISEGVWRLTDLPGLERCVN